MPARPTSSRPTGERQAAPAPGQAPVLDAAQRKTLRALAHHLEPVVAIGDAGLTPAVLAETDRALRAHGLIKIRVHGDDREARTRYLDALCAALHCAAVQSIGKLLVVWRMKPEPEGGGDAGTAKRRATRATKKSFSGAKDGATPPARKRSPPKVTAKTASKAGAGARNPVAGPARGSRAARPLTRSARPGSGTRARRRAP